MSKVFAIEFTKGDHLSFDEAFKQIPIDDLNRKERSVVVKVGIFSLSKKQYSTANTVNALVNGFGKAPEIFLVESNNYSGPAEKRLRIYNKVYTDRVAPFSLSNDESTREVKVADEKVALSSIVFKPNVFISTHIARRVVNVGKFEKLFNMGTILKNLLGLIPDKKKLRFHDKLPSALLDMYEAIGGIDLAVLDGTYTHLIVKKQKSKLKTNFVLVGRDAVSVDAVGAFIVGLDPLENPVIQGAIERGLGEGDLDRIEILGSPIEGIRQNIIQSFNDLASTST